MLRLLQSQLQAVYRIEAPDIEQFLLDDSSVIEVLGKDTRINDEWVLVREQSDGLELGVYIEESHLASLRSANHLGSAIDGHFSSFCVALEGVSHFLFLVDRARRMQPVSLLELEIQAEVDKYVCAMLHRPWRSREWRTRLFREFSLRDGLTAEEKERYLEAGRLADAFCGFLEALPHPNALIDEMRTFWRHSSAQRMEKMRRIAA